MHIVNCYTSTWHPWTSTDHFRNDSCTGGLELGHMWQPLRAHFAFRLVVRHVIVLGRVQLQLARWKSALSQNCRSHYPHMCKKNREYRFCHSVSEGR